MSMSVRCTATLRRLRSNSLYMRRDASTGTVDRIINLAMVAASSLSGRVMYSGLSDTASSRSGHVYQYTLTEEECQHVALVEPCWELDHLRNHLGLTHCLQLARTKQGRKYRPKCPFRRSPLHCSSSHSILSDLPSVLQTSWSTGRPEG